MTDPAAAAALYRRYIASLNRCDWVALGDFVDAGVRHDGQVLGVEVHSLLDPAAIAAQL